MRSFFRSCALHAVRWTFTLGVLVALLYAVYIGIRFHHIDTHVYAWFTSEDVPARAPSLAGRGLEHYRMAGQPLQVAGVRRNLSGLAFDGDAQQLIAVVNRPALLLTLSLEGVVTARHPLLHAADVEGVAYLGQGRVALVEEGRSRVLFTTLPDDATASIDLKESFALHLGLSAPERDGVLAGNVGFEGIGYDQARDQLYVAKEHSPRALYRISGLVPREEGLPAGVSIENLSHWVALDAVVGADLSSVEVDPATGHVLLLSDESQSVVELDRQGVFVGRLDLSSWGADTAAIPQAEGVAMGADGTLYIVSEPNGFYRFQLFPSDLAATPVTRRPV